MKTPTMNHEEVEQVSVEWLLKNLTGTVEYSLEEGDDWADLVNYKSQDGSFESLVATILDEGFRIPVVVQMWNDGDGVRQLYLGNGHHRMSAAILLCLNSVAVYWTESGDYMATGISYSTGDDELDYNKHRDFLRGLDCTYKT